MLRSRTLLIVSFFLHKIEVGLKQSEEGKAMPIDEVEAHLKRRRSKENK